MIANPVFADVLAVVVEELSLVGSLFGTGRTPFDFFKAKPKTTGNESFQRLKRSAYFFIGWTLLVIRFDPGPGNLPLLIDHVNFRMRNSFNLLSVISRIAKAVSVDNLMFRVRKKWEIDFALTIRGDL